MRELIEQEMTKVCAGADFVVQEESPSLVDDFLFFVAFGGAACGFGAFMLTFVFSQSIPLLVATTIGGVIFGVGACIAIEAALP